MGNIFLKTICAIAVLVTVIIPAQASEGPPWNADQLFDEAFFDLTVTDRLKILDEYITAFDESTPIEVKVQIVSRRIHSLSEAGNFKEASAFGEQVYEQFANTSTDNPYLTDLFFNIAQAHVKAANIEPAINVLDRIKAIAKITGENQAALASDSLMAQIYFSIGDYPNAANLMKNMLINEAYKEELNPFSETSLLSNVGYALARSGELEHALDYFDRASHTLEVYVSEGEIAPARAEIKENKIRIRRAYVLRTQGRYGELQTVAQSTYDKAVKLETPDIAAKALHFLGVYENTNGNLSRALAYFERSAMLANDAGAVDVLTTLLLDQSSAMAKAGDFEGAFSNLKRYNELRDAKQSKEASGRISLAYAQARLSERNQEIDQLKSMNETASLISKRDRKIALLSLVAVGMLVIVLGAVGFSYEHQRRAKSRLQESERRAQEASQAKSSFLANMSHEIRTPMNGVLGMAELLKDTNLNDKQTMFADTIYESGSALLTIINDILDYSKIEAGKLELDPAPLDLVDVVEDVASLLGISARDKGIELMVRIRPEVPVNLVGDAGRIRQTLTNLIGNAIKFTHSGSVLVDVTGHQEDDFADLKFTISDTGIGMSANQLASVFDEFTQAESSTTRKYGGTGLGLSITKSLVSVMGGTISAYSTLGKGSDFTVELRLPVTDAVIKEKYSVIEFNNDAALVVDDNSTNRAILEENLSRWGLKPILTKCVDEALVRMREAARAGDPIRVVITDYHMPEKDGLDFVRELVADKEISTAGVIVLSSVNNDTLVKEFKSLGVSEIFAKPVRMPLLQCAISEVLVQRNTTELKAMSDIAIEDEQEAGTELPVLGLPCILVADDNQVNRLVVENMIDSSKYEVHFAEDGKIAYQKFRANQYDLIFMDISMPVMDGIESLKAIRAYEAEHNLEKTPVVAITAHAMNGDSQRVLDQGMDDYLAKPIKQQQVAKALEKWVPPISPSTAAQG